MSLLEAVKPDLNVKNFSETPQKSEKPLWEMIKTSDIEASLVFNNRNILFLGFDLKSLPSFESQNEHYKSVAENLKNELLNYKSNQELLSQLLHYETDIRLSEGNIVGDYDNEDIAEKSYLRLYEIKEDCEEGSADVGVLEYIFNFKICFPSADVNPVINAFLIRYPTLLSFWFERQNKLIKSENHLQIIDSLRMLSYLKLLQPQRFENIDVKNSEIYKEAEKRGKIAYELGGTELKYAVGFASFLKFFGAEKAVLGSRGVELTMPEEKIESPTLELPTVRRFS